MAMDRRARRRADLDYSWVDSSWFSDNLAIAAAVSADPDFHEGLFGSVLLPVMWIQFLLALDGFFVRAGLTAGPQYMDKRTNFGPALVHAVLLEQIADMPRVLVSPNAVLWIRRFCGYYAKSYDAYNPWLYDFAEAPDGSLFVSYLAVTCEADDEWEALDMLTRHRDALDVAIVGAKTPKVQAKIRWVARYHNWYCDLWDPGNKDLQLKWVRKAAFAPFDKKKQYL